MFQLYSKRNFSSLVGDTFTLFKLEGKNYFKNYFIINGGLLLVLCIIIYFFMQIFLKSAFLASSQNNSNAFLDSILTNVSLFIIFGLAMILLIMFASLINYLYPVAYLKLVEEKKQRTLHNLTSLIKSKIGKTIQFYFLSIFIIVPLLLVLLGISFALVFVIIGVPILFILLPAYTSWVSLSYYEYISTNSTYFNALKKGLKLLKSKFWPVIGSNYVMQTIVQVVLGIVVMVPYFIGIFSIFINPEQSTQNSENVFSLLTILLTVITIISILFSYTLQNIILINQGIIYYSIIEEQENISAKNNIDLIGKNEE
jgi:hypothetical protein